MLRACRDSNPKPSDWESSDETWHICPECGDVVEEPGHRCRDYWHGREVVDLAAYRAERAA